jgi:hypothetical protein
MKNLAILLTVALVAAAAAYFAFMSDGIDEMTLVVDSGQATILRGGDQIRVKDSHQLKEGDLIRSDGTATLRLTGDRFAYLEGRTNVSVTNDHALDGQGGSLRAQSTAGDPMRVTFGDVAATATNSNFRIDQGVGFTRIGTYGGLVNLTTPGETDLQVPQFFEASVSVGDLPDKARPYRFHQSDTWDKQFLDVVMDLDADLTQTAGALTNQGGVRPSLEYFAGLTKKDVGVMQRYLKRSPDELLIGFTIADNSIAESFQRSFTRAFRLRDDGGRWGIVASFVVTSRKELVAELNDLVVGTEVAGGAESGADTGELTFSAGEDTASGPGDPSDPTDPTDPIDDPTDPKDPKDPKDPDEPSDDCQSGPECDLGETQEEIDDIIPGEDDESPPPDGGNQEDQPPLTDGVFPGGGGNGLP